MRRVQAVVPPPFVFVLYQTKVAASVGILHENSSRALPFHLRLVEVPLVEEISWIQNVAEEDPLISLLAQRAVLFVADVFVVVRLLAFPLTLSRFHFVCLL